MSLPSLQVLGIAANGDPSLFENLMAQAGLRVVPRNDDPLSTNVQEEAVAAVASIITEDAYHGVRMSPYHKQAKLLAERAGYVVMIENCGPPGTDPCEGELDTEEVAEMGGSENVGPEVEQIAALPIGTDLAAEILAVVNGEGPAALDMDSDAGLHGEMPIDELPPTGPEDTIDGEQMAPLGEVGEGEGEAMLASSGNEPKEFGEDEAPVNDDDRPF